MLCGRKISTHGHRMPWARPSVVIMKTMSSNNCTCLAIHETYTNIDKVLDMLTVMNKSGDPTVQQVVKSIPAMFSPLTRVLTSQRPPIIRPCPQCH